MRTGQLGQLRKIQKSAAAVKGKEPILGEEEGVIFAQALALCPGVSRSGVTMMTGLAVRLDRESAARYSFLLSVPVVGGAAVYKALHIAKDGLPAGTAMPFAVGIASAAISGMVAIWFVLRYLKSHNFNLFVLYRIVVGVAVLILIVAGVRSGMGI